MERYVGPMASFTGEGRKNVIKTPFKEDGSIDYAELVKRVNEYGRRLHSFYSRFQR